MKTKSLIAMVFLALLLGWGTYLYLAINNPFSTDVKTMKTDVQISSRRLASSFDVDEIQANAEFVEKTIEVVGVVKKVSFVNDRFTVLLQGREGVSNVICDIVPSSIGDAKELRLGQTVRLKGICKGYLKDVILLNCILINGRTDG